MRKKLLVLFTLVLCGAMVTVNAQYKTVDLSVKSGTTITSKASTDLIFHESFEGYDDFTTDLSPWITLQLTEGETYNADGFDFPGEGTAFAFMAFNPSTTEPPINESHPAVDGEKYAIAIQYEGTNDNKLLISPQISIENFNTKLSFFVKSITDQYGLDRFAVWVSTTDTEVESFEKISEGDFLEAPIDWTEFEFSLGEFAGQDIYFAIQYRSYDAFIFMLDDIRVFEDANYEYEAFISEFDFVDDIEVKSVAIDNEEFTVDITVAAGTDITALTPTITVSLGATIVDFSPSATIDFTNPVEFVVKSFDGETENTYTVTVDFETSVEEPAVISNLNVYPNPFTNEIRIANAENVSRITITNLIGQVVMDMPYRGETTINTSNLNNGLYLVVFQSENGQRVVRKMIKQ